MTKTDLGDFKTAWRRAVNSCCASFCGTAGYKEVNTDYLIIRRDEIVLAKSHTEETKVVSNACCGINCNCGCPFCNIGCESCFKSPKVNVSFTAKEPIDLYLRTKDAPVVVQVDVTQIETVLHAIMADNKHAYTIMTDVRGSTMQN